MTTAETTHFPVKKHKQKKKPIEQCSMGFPTTT